MRNQLRTVALAALPLLVCHASLARRANRANSRHAAKADDSAGQDIFQPDPAKRAEAFYNFTMGHLNEIYFRNYQSKAITPNAAMDFYKKAYALDPDSPVIGEHLAEMYYEARRAPDAVIEAQGNPSEGSQQSAARASCWCGFICARWATSRAALGAAGNCDARHRAARTNSAARSEGLRNHRIVAGAAVPDARRYDESGKHLAGFAGAEIRMMKRWPNRTPIFCWIRTARRKPSRCWKGFADSARLPAELSDLLGDAYIATARFRECRKSLPARPWSWSPMSRTITADLAQALAAAGEI